MTLFEALSLLTAVVAVIISVTALIRSRRLKAQQLEYEADVAALAKKQLAMLEQKDAQRDKAYLTADLVKIGHNDFRFVVTNHGPCKAENIRLELKQTASENPLSKNEQMRKLPYPLLEAGQSFSLKASIHLRSTLSYNTHLSWENPDGSQTQRELRLLL